MRDFLNKYIPLCILLFTFCLVALPHGGHVWDIGWWENWAIYIFDGGLGHVYTSHTDYPPLFHYILWLFTRFQGSFEDIGRNIHYLKLITLLFHFITGYFLVALVRKENQDSNRMIVYVLFYLLNIALLYNTIIWGQVDAILTSFAIISCYFAFRKKVLLSLVFIVLALNFKLQAIIFVPVIGLMLLPVIIAGFSVKKLLVWVFVPALLQFLILVPFIVSGTIDGVWAVVTGSVGKWPFVSMNAYNIWDFLLDGHLRSTPDNLTFAGISYKLWGLFMFFTASGIALFPLAKKGFVAIKNKIEWHVPLDKFLIICALIPLLFFYFNTQMHERYTHPAFAFLIAYSIYTRRPVVSVIGCLAYFLNMEGVLQFMDLNNYKTLIFNRDFISFLYLVTIAWLYADLYELRSRREKRTGYTATASPKSAV